MMRGDFRLVAMLLGVCVGASGCWNPIDAEDIGSAGQALLRGVVRAEDGSELEAMDVLVGETRVRTDANGNFEAPVPPGELNRVRVDSRNFAGGEMRISLDRDTEANVQLSVMRTERFAIDDASAGGRFQRNGFSLEVPEGALRTEAGEMAEGRAEARYARIDDARLARVAPDMRTEDGRPLRSEGLIEVRFFQDDAPLRFEGTAEVEVPLPAGTMRESGERIRLYHYDAEAGRWTREAEAEVVDGKWTARLDRFSWWMVASVIEDASCVSLTPQTSLPGQAVMLTATAEDQIYAAQVQARAGDEACVPVPSDSTISLSAMWSNGETPRLWSELVEVPEGQGGACGGGDERACLALGETAIGNVVAQAEDGGSVPVEPGLDGGVTDRVDAGEVVDDVDAGIAPGLFDAGPVVCSPFVLVGGLQYADANCDGRPDIPAGGCSIPYPLDDFDLPDSDCDGTADPVDVLPSGPRAERLFAKPDPFPGESNVFDPQTPAVAWTDGTTLYYQRLEVGEEAQRLYEEARLGAQILDVLAIVGPNVYFVVRDAGGGDWVARTDLVNGGTQVEWGEWGTYPGCVPLYDPASSTLYCTDAAVDLVTGNIFSTLANDAWSLLGGQACTRVSAVEARCSVRNDGTFSVNFGNPNDATQLSSVGIGSLPPVANGVDTVVYEEAEDALYLVRDIGSQSVLLSLEGVENATPADTLVGDARSAYGFGLRVPFGGGAPEVGYYSGRLLGTDGTYLYVWNDGRGTSVEGTFESAFYRVPVLDPQSQDAQGSLDAGVATTQDAGVMQGDAGADDAGVPPDGGI